ncbi:MAG: 4-hydroxy-2-oxovalerate aldolase [Anaerolineae bacterium]|nr:4-hydroxy-2-oxovalerate aldolase [Anaerolineae bacterium]
MTKHIRVVDTTLRDGMHSVGHQFTPEQMAGIASGLDAAGIYAIEVSHGDGLGGSSIQYGRAAASDAEYLQAVALVLRRSRLAVLLLPGIGVKEDIDKAAALGATVARVATHVTEADIAEQHIGLAKKRGMEVIGFLMMAHMAPADVMVQNARLMEAYGADYVYVVDSAGYLLPPDVTERVVALKQSLNCKVGFHAHNNLGLAIGNCLAAVEAGADILDGSLRAMGAGGGNAPTETLIAVLSRLGIDTGVDLYSIMDAAKRIDPFKQMQKQGPDATLMLGYAGVYSSFLLHTARAAERFNVDPRDILVELGRRRIVGGQEDMIIDIAYELSQGRNLA